MPNPATGRTAAAMRASVSRVRKPSPSRDDRRGRRLDVRRRHDRRRSAVARPPRLGERPRPARSVGEAAVRSAAGRRRRAGPPVASRRRRSPSSASVVSAALARPDQPVADAAHGQQVDGLVGVDLDLLAQPPHRHPDVARVGVLGVGPAAGEQRLGRDGLAEVRGQRVEEPRLGRRERHRLAADDRLAPVELEREVRAEVQALARHPVAEPAQHPRDPRPQLRVVVGLGDVVLGDLVEEVGLGVRRVDRRQDDDRQVGAGLDLARERQPVHARHQHVDDQEVRPGLRQAAQRLVAVARGRDLVAVDPELVGEDDEQVGVVVNDQDPRRRDAVRSGAAVHGRRIAARIGVPSGRRAAGAAGRGGRGSVRASSARSAEGARAHVVRAAARSASVAGRASSSSRPNRRQSSARPFARRAATSTLAARRSRAAGASRTRPGRRARRGAAMPRGRRVDQRQRAAQQRAPGQLDRRRRSATPASSGGERLGRGHDEQRVGQAARAAGRAARRDASAMASALASTPMTSRVGSAAAVGQHERPSPVPRSITTPAVPARRVAS